MNQQKSAVARPWERKFLGFSFTGHREPQRRIAPKAILRFKERIRELTRRTRGVSVEDIAEDLSRYLRGWQGYFGLCQTPYVLRDLEYWLRRRLRAFLWKQWKRGTVRFAELTQRGVNRDSRLERQGAIMAPGGSPNPLVCISHCPMLILPRSAFRNCSASTYVAESIEPPDTGPVCPVV